VTWLVRPTPVGTAADTPHSLRRKAREFLRLASEAKDPERVAELSRLASTYTDRAMEMEAGIRVPAGRSTEAL
jgi:hypothetical protein